MSSRPRCPPGEGDHGAPPGGPDPTRASRQGGPARDTAISSSPASTSRPSASGAEPPAVVFARPRPITRRTRRAITSAGRSTATRTRAGPSPATRSASIARPSSWPMPPSAESGTTLKIRLEFESGTRPARHRPVPPVDHDGRGRAARTWCRPRRLRPSWRRPGGADRGPGGGRPRITGARSRPRSRPFRDELAALRKAEEEIDRRHPDDDGDEGAGGAEGDPHPDAGRTSGARARAVTPRRAVPPPHPRGPAGQPARPGALAGGPRRTRSWPGSPSTASGSSSSASGWSRRATTSARRASGPATPSCSTGWPPSSSPAAGTSRRSRG